MLPSITLIFILWNGCPQPFFCKTIGGHLVDGSIIYTTAEIVIGSSNEITFLRTLGRGKNWWKLDSGIDIPIELKLVNDHNSHWLWQPSRVMPMEEYKSALRQVGELFYKIN